jgi:hypothetical protein
VIVRWSSSARRRRAFFIAAVPSRSRQPAPPGTEGSPGQVLQLRRCNKEGGTKATTEAGRRSVRQVAHIGSGMSPLSLPGSRPFPGGAREV